MKTILEIIFLFAAVTCVFFGGRACGIEQERRRWQERLWKQSRDAEKMKFP